jgi:DNA-binding MarR family transcriptional regulator
MENNRELLIQSATGKMRDTMRCIRDVLGFPFAGYTLGPPLVRILFVLAYKRGGTSVKELADVLSVTSGAVTQFIDVLVEKGLVTREEDPNDRRLLQIKLTKFARSKFKEFKKDYFVAMSKAFTNLSNEEIMQLITLLNKIDITSITKETLK